MTTLDMENVPKNEDGTVDYTKDFFGKETSLTVSGQLNARRMLRRQKHLYIRTDFPRGEFQHNETCGGILDDRAGDRVRGSGG